MMFAFIAFGFLLILPALWMYTDFLCDPTLLRLRRWWQAFTALLSLIGAVAIFGFIFQLPGIAYYDRSRVALGVACVVLVGISAGFALVGRRQQSDLSRRVSHLVLGAEFLMTSYALLALFLAPAI